MGRLSAYAKNRILKLRFKRNKRIIHIVEILKQEDNIKVSRQAVSTFLKKYLDTNSIYDKPRTGRKRKLTQEEIQLIGQVTRLNRDITARAIKEYLNLNVSTYTILRATKMFEWNKVNPNSNDSKKAAAMERQMNGESPIKSPEKNANTTANTSASSFDLDTTNESIPAVTSTTTVTILNNLVESELNSSKEPAPQTNEQSIPNKKKLTKQLNFNKELDLPLSSSIPTKIEEIDPDELKSIEATELELEDTTAPPKKVAETEESTQESAAAADKNDTASTSANTQQQQLNVVKDPELVDLKLIGCRELAALKNLSCSPMSFATKILFKIFRTDELHGHNVSGKTLNKNVKVKLPLDPRRVSYIRFLVESYYNEKECREMLCGHNQDLWRSCHTAINKSILISERKAASGAISAADAENAGIYTEALSQDDENELFDAGFLRAEEDDNDSEIEHETISLRRKSTTNTAPRIGKPRRMNLTHNSKKRSNPDDAEDNHEDDGDEFANEDFESSNDEPRPLAAKKFTRTYFHRIDAGLERLPPQKRICRRSSQKLSTSERNENTDESVDEIELIQNIENRLTSTANLAPIITQQDYQDPTANHQNSVTTSKSKKPAQPKSQKVKTIIHPVQQSSEASAASNIAAAMSKRFVVVAAVQIQPVEAKHDKEELHNEKKYHQRTRKTQTFTPSRLVKPPPVFLELKTRAGTRKSTAKPL